MKHTPESRRAAQSLGALIQSRRLSRGLTQRQLATALGVSAITILRWEGGACAPYPKQYPTIMATLGITGAEIDSVMRDGRT